MHEIQYDKGQNDQGEYEIYGEDQEVLDAQRRKKARVGICVLSLKELCIFIPKEDSFE